MKPIHSHIISTWIMLILSIMYLKFCALFVPLPCVLSYNFQLHNISWTIGLYVTKIYWTVEIKCQPDATEVFIANLIASSTCYGHHYAHHQELESIVQWLLPVVFGAVVFKLLVWCGAEGYVSCLQDAAARNTTGSNHFIILLSSWWWA